MIAGGGPKTGILTDLFTLALLEAGDGDLAWAAVDRRHLREIT